MATPAQTAYEEAAGREGRVKELVLQHLPLVKRIVNRLAVCLSPALSEEDLIGAGTLGLVEAAHRYDETRGVTFVTFAYCRIKGAILDLLRQNDALGRSARERVKALRRHVRDFVAAHGRRPTIEELAEQANMSEQQVLKWLAYEKWDVFSSIEESGCDEDADQPVLAALIPAGTPSPSEELEWKEKLERLARAIERLPEREKQVIIMYYYEDMFMSEMAEVLHVSESRVSQLHTRALYNLMRMLEAPDGGGNQASRHIQDQAG